MVNGGKNNKNMKVFGQRRKNNQKRKTFGQRRRKRTKIEWGKIFGEGKYLVSGGEEKRRGKRRIISGEGKDLANGGKNNQNRKVIGQRRGKRTEKE